MRLWTSENTNPTDPGCPSNDKVVNGFTANGERLLDMGANPTDLPGLDGVVIPTL